MNENDIDVLLDHFVGALDSTESASVAQKINTLPGWSKTYNQINLVFGSLNTIKEEDSKQPAPEGLASKTLQKILEQKTTQHNSPEFIAQKSDSSEQAVRPTTRKRLSVKPSILVFSACAGFLFVTALIFSTNNLGVTNPKPSEFTSVNNSTDFAVTGSSQQPSSQLFFCSDPVSDSAAPISFSNDNNSLAVNYSSEPMVDLTGTVPAVAEPRDRYVKMACPDGFVVLSSRPEGRPIIVVQPPRHLPGELQNIQEVVNQPNANFVVPVNYQK